MQRIKFTKMNGLGNDYIYINCFEQNINMDNVSELAIKLSDRHFGIGGDGIVLILPASKSVNADAQMRMFNADGSEGKMCGNAIRCVARYLVDNGIVRGDRLKIETKSGVKSLSIDGEMIAVNMGKPILEPSEIPVLMRENRGCIKVLGEDYNITCVSMGNPHCVIFTNDIDKLDLNYLGPHFENHEAFPERINTEFVEILDSHRLSMRVYERGSGETLACGTGACASVVAATINNLINKNEEIKVILRGGQLSIRYTDEGVIMTGQTQKVFEGVVEV